MTLGYHIWSNLVHSPVMNEKRLMLIVLCTVCFVLWGTLYLSSILVFFFNLFSVLIVFFYCCITPAHAGYSLYFTTGWEMPLKLPLPLPSPQQDDISNGSVILAQFMVMSNKHTSQGMLHWFCRFGWLEENLAHKKVLYQLLVPNVFQNS